MKSSTLYTFLLLTSLSHQALATNPKPLENIAQELVNIRQKIETLHNKISFEKESYQDQMRSYANEKSDLNVRISRTELNIKDLQRELKKLTDANKEKNKSQRLIKPIVLDAIKNLRQSVAASLPFKLKQRLQALDDIALRLNTNIISPNKAANQLWAFAEDELMLGKSSGIYNDSLNVNGREKLVKVLRIGKIAMFFKTAEGKFGVLKNVQNTWQQEMLESPESITQLEYLFDSYAKNIRTGQFEVPNFLPKS